MSTRSASACAVVAAVVLTVTGCGQSSTQPTPVAATAERGPTTVRRPPLALSPGQAPAAPGCDPRVSLRPQDPLPAPGHMPAGSTMAHIAQRGYLVAGVNQDAYLFASRDENLRLQGFDVDVVRDIAEAIFGDPEKVVFRQVNVADRVKTASSGDVDLVVATMSITCKRREEVNFSTVYYVAGQRVLVNRGSGFTSLADLGGRRVCAASGSTALERVQAATPKPISVSVLVTTDCLALLQLGEVDAVSTDDGILASMAAQDSRTEVVGPRFTDEPYGVAIKRDTPDLVRFVNGVLERRIQDGRWRASYEHWLMGLLGSPSKPPTPNYQD